MIEKDRNQQDIRPDHKGANRRQNNYGTQSLSKKSLSVFKYPNLYEWKEVPYDCAVLPDLQCIFQYKHRGQLFSTLIVLQCKIYNHDR